MTHYFTKLITLISILLSAQAYANDVSYLKYPLIDRYSLDEPMQFHHEADATGCMMVGCEWISAIGIITKNTPREFLEFVKELNYSPTIYFASNGGNLIAGLELGEIIRDKGYSTNIGYTKTTSNEEFGADRYKALVFDGSCLSACAYAYLGGVRRDIYEKSKYGLHQHYDQNSLENFDTKTASQLDRTFDQIVTGLILEYAIKMDINPKVVSTASLQTPDGIHYLSKKEMVNWNVINSIDKYSKPHILPFGVKGAILEIQHLSGYNANYENPTKYRVYCKGNSKTPHIAMIEIAPTDSNLANIWDQLINDAGGFEFWGKEGVHSNAILVSKQAKKLQNGKTKYALAWSLPELHVSDLANTNVIFPSQQNGGTSRAWMPYEQKMTFHINDGERHLRIVLNNCIK